MTPETQKRVVEMLRQLEWRSDYGDACPQCRGYADEGHEPDCSLKALLDEIEREERLEKAGVDPCGACLHWEVNATVEPCISCRAWSKWQPREREEGKA